MRAVLYLVGALIAFAVLRGSAGLLGKLFQEMTGSGAAAPKDPNTVDMVKCPSCGSIFAPGQHPQKQQQEHQHRP